VLQAMRADLAGLLGPEAGSRPFAATTHCLCSPP